MSTHARAVLLASMLFVGCDATPVSSPDAGPGDDGGADSGAEPGLQWSSGPDYPIGIAFGAAMVLPANGSQYLYAFGGASGSFVDLGELHADVRRAEILADHSLGPWEIAGRMSTGSSDIALAGHDAIRIRGEDGAHGVAMAGGGIATSALPLIFVGYVDDASADFSMWGRFDPMLEEGQWFASWDAFEPHHFALVGGMVDGAPTDRVRIGIIENGAMSPTFLPGPSLPSARFGHASVVMRGEVYLIGGEGTEGAINEVLRTTRDAMENVNGWAPAGQLTSRLVFPAAAAVEDTLYVIGGLTGDATTGAASARVLSGTLDASGDLATVGVVDGAALPEPLAASLVAVDAGYVYVIGGIAAGDASPSAHVYWTRLP